MQLFGCFERQNRCEMSQVTQDKNKWFRRVSTDEHSMCCLTHRKKAIIKINQVQYTQASYSQSF